MARLTPKQGEKERQDYWEKAKEGRYTDNIVCYLIGIFGTKKVIPLVEETINTHDQLTQPFCFRDRDIDLLA